MDIIAWLFIGACFIISFVGLVYPIIPSVLFIGLGFILYGIFYTFHLPWWFWLIEILLIVLLFSADTLVNLLSVKTFGGSKAGMWGSTVGLIFGPFILPFAGIILGPFLGAIIAELLFERTTVKQAVKTGIGSVVGFLTSVVTKGIVQIVMIVLFFIAI